jgi:hypothetical protein
MKYGIIILALMLSACSPVIEKETIPDWVPDSEAVYSKGSGV